MAAKIADTTKPTFYLDQSTLCEAFAALSLPGSRRAPHSAYRRVVPWIERIASEANFCLSIAHLLELAAWQDTAAADGVAAWLDALPVVWMLKLDTILAEEADHWLQTALGTTPRPVQPFAPSMWRAFENWTPSSIAIATEHASIPGALGLFREMNHRGGAELSKAGAQAFRVDRAQFAAWTSGQKTERIGQKIRAELRKIAGDAHQRFEASGDSTYAALGQTWGGVMDPFVEFVERTPEALPAWRVMCGFSEGFAEVAVARTPGSKGDRELSSSVNDGLHAALGVYCDVFTCDALMSRMLADTRVRLGRHRQLSAGEIGDAEAFVDALTTTWP